jgi:hypothetical protein
MAQIRQGPARTTPVVERQVGPGWFIGIVLLLAVMTGVFAFNQFNAADPHGDDASLHAGHPAGPARDR